MRSLALVLCSSTLLAPNIVLADSRQGTGVWNRAEQLRTNRHTTKQLRTVERLQGKVVVNPIVVQPQKGPTVVSGNTFISSEPVITQGRNYSAAMLHLLGAEEGAGKIILRGNRFINRGHIVSNGGKAGMSILHDNGLPLSVISHGNIYENDGEINATE